MDINSFIPELSIQSPGRINLIGEHIDYNGGWVLPAAIDKAIRLRFRKKEGRICEIYSEVFQEGFKIDLDQLLPKESGSWQNYILGVLYEIEQLKPAGIGGFDCILNSDLPLGAGISSSAALECGLAKGLNELFQIGLTDMQIIQLSMAAEHEFVGNKCGIMDQFAVVKGQAHQLVLLNCDSLDYELVPANFDPYTLILLNTNVTHNLAGSEYNQRRADCEKALEIIQERYPKYCVLTMVPATVLAEFKTSMPPVSYQRAAYVIAENQRTLNAVKALHKKDFKSVGASMYASHQGLSQEYEVSCPELDFLVDYTQNLEAILGARMMGGGFGGCTINLIHKNSAAEFITEISAAYAKQFNKKLTAIPIKVGDGVKKIEL